MVLSYGLERVCMEILPCGRLLGVEGGDLVVGLG